MKTLIHFAASLAAIVAVLVLAKAPHGLEHWRAGLIGVIMASLARFPHTPKK